MAPNEPISKKRSLEGAVDSLATWLEIFTALVVVGLIVEYGPEIFIDIVEKKPPSSGLVGGLLITIGVAGELLIGFRANRKEAELREVNDLIIAEANERAARAEQSAAEATLARVKIEEKLAPRKLTEAARADLVEALAPFEGRKVDVVIYDVYEDEVHRLGVSLDETFKLAGWRSQLSWIEGGFRLPGRGLTLGIASEASQSERIDLQAIVELISSVFRRYGFDSDTSIGGFSTTERLKAVASPVWRIKDAAIFRVQLGRKELLIDRPS
jgi:hypothetical protein